MKKILIFLVLCFGGLGLFHFENQQILASEPIAPKVLKDFESDVIGEGAADTLDFSAGTLSKEKNYASINTDAKYVRSGEKSLQLNFDFTSETGTTVVALDVFKKSTVDGTISGSKEYCIPIEGNPSHIGAWIYGDGSGVDIRGILKHSFNTTGTYAPSKYFAYQDRVDWVGWKYVEWELGSDLVGKEGLYLSAFVRAVSSSAYSKTKGTVYIDDIQAIYDGNRTNDVTGPTVTPVMPLQDAKVPAKGIQIEAKIEEDLSNILNDEIQLKLDDTILTDFRLESTSTGYVLKYEDALLQMKSGTHRIEIVVKNDVNYKTIQTWTFEVLKEGVEITELVENKEEYYVGETGVYQLYASQYNDFSSYVFQAKFDSSVMEITSIDINDTRLTVEKNVYDNTQGTVECKIAGMNQFTKSDDEPLIEIHYRIKGKGTVQIDIEASQLTMLNETKGISIAQGFELPSDYKYRVEVGEAVQGEDVEIKVYEKGILANEVEVFLLGDSPKSLGTTIQGVLMTEELASYVKGSALTLQVQQDGYSSETVTVTVQKNMNAQKITIANDLEILSGTTHPLLGTIYNPFDEELEGEITWQLVHQISGVSITEDSLVVDLAVLEGTKINIKATYQSVEENIEITVVRDETASNLELELLSSTEIIRPDSKVYFQVILTNRQEQIVAGAVTWSLKEEIQGVTIENGKLTIGKDVEAGTKIIVVATHGQLCDETEVTVQGLPQVKVDSIEKGTVIMVGIGCLLGASAITSAIWYFIMKRRK